MTIEALVCSGYAVRSRAARILLAASAVVLVSLPSAAQAQSETVCGPEVKEEVVKALAGVDGAEAELAVEKELYAKYQFCTQDAQQVPSTFFVAARECGAAVSNLGSLFYEEMSCSGYDPQRRQFASPIKIKQTFGFGGAPLPGSREHVLHCVADASGTLVPVGRDSVHLANAIGNQRPTWQFAVIANANQNLQTIYPMDGSDPQGPIDPVLGADADRLQLHADLGQCAELPHPPRSVAPRSHTGHGVTRITRTIGGPASADQPLAGEPTAGSPAHFFPTPSAVVAPTSRYEWRNAARSTSGATPPSDARGPRAAPADRPPAARPPIIAAEAKRNRQRRFDPQILNQARRETLAPDRDRHAERQPAHTSRSALLSTIRVTSRRVAPRAIRMPISVVRRATVYANSP